MFKKLTAFTAGLYAAMATMVKMASSVGKTLQPRKNNFNFSLNSYKHTKGNPTRWRSVKQDLQTQSQKRHRADKRVKNV